MTRSTRPPRKAYKIRGPETWALIREAYLGGAPARVLAERYDVTDWAIWRRAYKEGWTKSGRAARTAPAAGPLPALFGPAEAGGPRVRDTGDLQADAIAASEAAMRQGRLEEALRLARLAESYGRLKMQRPHFDLRR